MEVVTTAAVFSLCLGLVEVVKLLVQKFVPASEKSVESRACDCNAQMASAVEKIAVAQEKTADVLDRIERRLEKLEDQVVELRLVKR